MTVSTSPVRKTPWLAIGLGILALLCLCAIVIGVAAFAFFSSTRVSTATEAAPNVVTPLETEVPTTVPPQETQESTNTSTSDAAPAGTAVDIGNNMTLTILDVTRPADQLVAEGSALNATAPEGEEFMRVDVEVTCTSDAGAACTFYPTVMKAVLPDGSTRDLQIFIEGVDDWDTAVEIEGGATRQGFLLFLVLKSDTDLVLSYQDVYENQPVYLQLP